MTNDNQFVTPTFSVCCEEPKINSLQFSYQNRNAPIFTSVSMNVLENSRYECTTVYLNACYYFCKIASKRMLSRRKQDVGTATTNLYEQHAQKIDIL